MGFVKEFFFKANKVVNFYFQGYKSLSFHSKYNVLLPAQVSKFRGLNFDCHLYLLRSYLN